MNIIVKTASGHVIVRPDTTWEKNSGDFFPPEFVEGITGSPVLFARISKPGRSIGRAFTGRYYDAIGFGVLLYPENMVDGCAEGFAAASCLDHTSFLPVPLFSRATLGNRDNEFRMDQDGAALFQCNPGTECTCGTVSSDLIEDAVAEASRMIYFRTGDLIAIELELRTPLCSREDGRDASTRITATWCGAPTLDFNIIL